MVAVSGDISSANLLSDKLDAVLQNIEDYQILAINDKHRLLDSQRAPR